MHTYPGLLYAPFWPTQDKVVPWGVFWVMYGAIGKLTALDRLQAAMGTALGAGLAFGKQGGPAERAVNKLFRTVYPRQEV